MATIDQTGMSLLGQPEAQVLLADAEVKTDQVRGCRRRLERFLDRYVPLFYRKEQGHNARIVVEGLLSGLQRRVPSGRPSRLPASTGCLASRFSSSSAAANGTTRR